MVGMTTGCSVVGNYGARYVAIDVAGVINQATSRVSNYQIKVPLSQMSTAMHNISCQGGKVVNVEVLGAQSLGVVQPSLDQKPPVLQVKSIESNQEVKAVVPDKKASHQKKTKSHGGSRKGRRSRK
ncbi:phycobilisome linker polypeptide [Leptothoe sp. PORK10 BA2]|uniref:phycobilisome linker polypeptide n=1 Tax=Leptothoe sp. PORK10 BA2 TaxID=3110254 RepID=UPI002B21630E|nr:phycobilisome linker polypeptide [Leptothoe sp. PORK10 BA2]MEA5465410.1 phycobilisome linker polypeptide [Leptothoe sp. PORK10 BA2]